MSRTFNTSHREKWNSPIHHILKAIDHHNSEYFNSGDNWHLEKAKLLRQYLTELKSWIKNKENND